MNERRDWEPDPPPEKGGGGSLLRGCAIAVGIAFLLLALVVGQCFI